VTFARRYVAGALVVLVVALGTLVWHAGSALRTTLEADVAAVLEREARLVSAALGPDTLAWQRTITRYAAATGNRITLVDRTGRVVADSDFRLDPIPALDSHADRPEVRTALGGGVGRDVRESETVGRDLMYVAVAGGPGVVRVAEELARATVIASDVQRAMGIAAILALAVGLIAAMLAARATSKPLAELAGAARAIAAGSPPRFPHSGISEIDALVRALREMHQQLAARFGELRQEQATSAALVESMTEGVVAADARGQITSANGAARSMLGYGPDDQLPELGILFHTKAARDLIARALDSREPESGMFEMDGRALLLTVRSLPGGESVLILRDLTDARRLEAVRRDFVANVSHELRTPLTSIRGYAETLLTDDTDGEIRGRFAATILANAERMQRLVDDLLDLSKLESGAWRPAPEPTDAAVMAREVWANFAARPEAGTITFTTSGDGIPANADPEALRQILTNLLDNSLRHTPAGGRIAVSVTQGDGGATVAVQDTGSGIPAEHLSRIFERFYRADAGRSRHQGGTGLGLAIVKHLVEGHGGRVMAASERGQGATISCWFPA
jgi:signal transduction histidine kinase